MVGIEPIGQSGRIGLNQTPVLEKSKSVVRVHRQNIGLAPRLEHPSELGIASVERISQNPGTGQSGIKGGRDHLPCHRWFGREHDVFWNACLETSRFIRCPVLGEIKAAIDQGMAEPTGIGNKNAYLAVLDTARRSGILPTDTDRVGAFLEEPRLVHN